MRVAIDISPLKSAHKFRGVGSYTKRLIEALQKVDKKNEYILTTRSLQLTTQVDFIHYPYFDLFFLTLPLRKSKPTVVTIHDVTPLVFPEHFPPGIRGKIKFKIQKFSLKGVKAVITDSKNSKKDIINYLGYPKEKIFVVPLAPGKEFRLITNHQSLIATKQKYQLPDAFVLYVGDVNYNKNIPGLVKTCEKIKVPLVIVGKQAVEKNINRLHPENKDLVWLQDYCQSPVTLLGFVSTEDLVAIYNLATVYCQPSFYEGFGLPVLEAMACGCPVVAANTSSLPEICGKAAVMVNPYDINDIVTGLKKVLYDISIYDILRKRGLAWVKKFSWEKTAKETIKVYQNVYQENR